MPNICYYRSKESHHDAAVASLFSGSSVGILTICTSFSQEYSWWRHLPPLKNLNLDSNFPTPGVIMMRRHDNAISWQHYLVVIYRTVSLVNGQHSTKNVWYNILTTRLRFLLSCNGNENPANFQNQMLRCLESLHSPHHNHFQQKTFSRRRSREY